MNGRSILSEIRALRKADQGPELRSMVRAYRGIARRLRQLGADCLDSRERIDLVASEYDQDADKFAAEALRLDVGVTA